MALLKVCLQVGCLKVDLSIAYLIKYCPFRYKAHPILRAFSLDEGYQGCLLSLLGSNFISEL